MDKIANLPAPMKWFLGVTGLSALFSAGWLGSRGGWKMLLIFSLALVLLLIILVGGYLLWAAWKRRQQNARFGGDLQQSTTAAPRGMSANDLAKLESLRKKFQEGVEAFKSRGKDLYTLPWYVIIGEPGSGKTEAVRHCNVGFPPGMHEGANDTGYMGAGGTINMNWWFTNFAVLLDTAGRLVFEDVKPGETSEWKEFLKLLKKNRPNCPINGLLLVIPSDSLIKDSADSIAAKAGKIAQQLDLIQRVLDFRFPVYVVISKSDKIYGFREFFENITDPQLQHQMMGWSNPEPLDSTFKPDLVDKHLTHVADRLRRRRLGLLRDPVPQSATRRFDEVDSLYALPNSLLILAPRLRKYLEAIFLPGEWSAKPLFLRGIYFTSSMREGAALDQELAEAIGVGADDLPEGKVWERDRAYFLKDLFVDKIFRERGLVTRATNTGAMLRRRQLFLYASIFLALSIFVTVAWLGKKAIGDRVADRAKYWVAARDAGWVDGVWKYPLIVPDNQGGFVLATNRYSFAGSHLTVAEFHQKLRDLAANNLKESWTMPGLAAAYNSQSKLAQRVLFETGVLKPISDAVQKGVGNPQSEVSQAAQPDALAAAIRLEADISNRRKGQSVEMNSRVASAFLEPFSRFLTGQDAARDTNLVQTMVWTYATNQAGLNTWPPSWLSSSTFSNGVSSNAVLLAGLDYCIRAATNTMHDAGAGWIQVTNFQAALRSWDQAEKLFWSAVQAGDPQAAKNSLPALKDARALVDVSLKAAATNDLFKKDILLASALDVYTNRITSQVLAVFQKIDQANASALTNRPGDPLFVSIANRLKIERSAFGSSLLNFLSPSDRQEFDRFDSQLLAGPASARAYSRRCSLYEHAVQSTESISFADATTPLLAAALRQTLSDRAALESEFKAYAGPATNELAAVAQFYLGRIDSALARSFTETYVRQSLKELDPLLGFPLTWKSTNILSPSGLDAAATALQSTSDTLHSEAFQQLKPANPAAWKAFAASVEDLKSVAGFLKGKDGKLTACTISLRKPDDTSSAAEKWRKRFRGIALLSPGLPTNKIKVEFDEEQVLGTLAIDKPCAIQLFQVLEDSAPKNTIGFPGDWSPLALIFNYQGKPETEGNFKTWFLTCKFKTADEDYALTLKLAFDDPLPDLKKWPAGSLPHP